MFQMTQSIHLIPEHGPSAPGQEDVRTAVHNAEIAEVLFNIATLLELQQDNPYRIAAYRNAARNVLALNGPVADIVARGERLTWPGLGDRLRRKITELASTGRMTFYDALLESSLPADARELMSVPYVGPKTALRLVDVLDIHSVAQLLEATQAHRVRQYFGFGIRSEQRLQAGALAVLTVPDNAA